jgi:diguanylate cyclase (GGDEF)-like protein/PAS domain S-box-containing protein
VSAASPLVRLLLVDDAPFTRGFIERLLHSLGEGVQLEWMPDYDTGLEALLTARFDVCLLDYQLGSRNGLELLEAARRARVRTPIIMLTGTASRELDQQCMRAGADDFVLKGELSPAALERVLRYNVERTRTREALRQSEERYALALEGSNDGLWDWQVGGQQIHLSSRWTRILGYEPAEFPDVLEAWWDRVHEDDRFRLVHEFEAYTRDATSPHFTNEHRLLHRDGTYRHVLVRGKAVRDAEGRATRMAGSLTDVTMPRSRDTLTGLANRVLFLDRLEHHFHRAQRDAGCRFAVLFIDVDRFKNVNDSLGHEVGDELLVQVAARLEGCVRLVDTVARLGGDEFVVLLDESREPEDATRVAGRIIEELARAFSVGSRSLFTGASVGIALWAPHYRTPGELLRDADNAMYRAKDGGRGRFVIFDNAMHARAVHVQAVESGLRRALDHQQLEVFYQPVISLETQQPLGFEALVRWRHPERGLVSPADFVPVAEDSSLIVLLDLHVLRLASNQLQRWRTQFGLDLSISVNTSRRHLSREGFADDVEQAVQTSGLPASALRLEVTESVTMDLSDRARAQLQRIHEAGVKLYVDDFGVGYSSLSMLHTYPFAGIKLDRSFVSALDAPSPSTEVVRAILAIAQALHLDVVAEGIETEAQHEALVRLGCPRGQGYRLSPPLPADAAEQWLRSKL